MVRIDVLYNKGIISLEDVVKLGRKNIKKVNMENIDVVKELVGEEKTEVIVKEIFKDEMEAIDNLLYLALSNLATEEIFG